MKKLTSTMMLVCVITTAFTGCATRFYGIEVSNVPNVSRESISGMQGQPVGVGVFQGGICKISIHRDFQRVSI